jgi:hypothetical protein
MPRFVRWIWEVSAIHLGLGMAAYLHFLLTGSYQYLSQYFWIAGTAFFLLATAVELFLALQCRAGFEPDEPMRLAWTLIALASVSRFSGTLLNTANRWHLTWITGQTSSALALVSLQGLAQAGAVVGGPLAMLFLAAGLGRVLQVQHRFQVLGGLTRSDQSLIALIAVFTLGQVANILHHVGPHPPLSVVALWLSDPLLALLLIEAVLIRRAIIRVGLGLISQCWGMYVLAIVATLAGDASRWAESEGLLSDQLTALSWYIWFFAAAAFTSAPAFQLAAMSLPMTQENALHKDG